MRNITIEEHNELMAFLSDKANQLYGHEVKMAIEKGQEPKNVYQGIFNIQQCGALNKGNATYYIVFTRSFLNLIRKFIPTLTQKEPDVFIKRDANDILEELNEISGYSKFNKEAKDFLKYISTETCVYVVTKVDGIFEDKVLRIDLCRGIRYNNHQHQEFYGGLLHVAKHFYINDANAVNSTYDLERLLSLSMSAFTKILPDEDKKIYSICLPYDNKHSLQFVFYKEEFTNVYYINTIYPIRNSVIETFYSNNKFGLKNAKDGVIVPCKYDDVTYDEKANCYVCKRDGKYAEDYRSKSYNGVIDMYSATGELLIGGGDDYHYRSDMDVFFIHFGGVNNGKWLMLDHNMRTTFGNVNYYGKIINVNDDKETNLLESCTFDRYHILNDTQVVICQKPDNFIDFGPECTPYRIVFAKEHTISDEHYWYYSICENLALYIDSNEKLGITNGKCCSQAKYDYISKPYKGWCIGIAHDDKDKKKGHCELIDTSELNALPVVLYNDMFFYSLEEFVKNDWALICDISELSEKCIGKVPTIIVPEQIFKTNIPNESIKNNFVCGSGIKDTKNNFEFIASDVLIKDKEEYTKRVCPKRNYNSGRVSPLDAFEGDEELYNDWLINS